MVSEQGHGGVWMEGRMRDQSYDPINLYHVHSLVEVGCG